MWVFGVGFLGGCTPKKLPGVWTVQRVAVCIPADQVPERVQCWRASQACQSVWLLPCQWPRHLGMHRFLVRGTSCQRWCVPYTPFTRWSWLYKRTTSAGRALVELASSCERGVSWARQTCGSYGGDTQSRNLYKKLDGLTWFLVQVSCSEYSTALFHTRNLHARD